MVKITKIKNNTGSLVNWVGQDIAPGQYYQIEFNEESEWMDNVALETLILSGDAVVNNGTSDITNGTDGLDYLRAMDAGCVRSVIIDDSSKGDKKYMKYDSMTNTIKYVNPMVEMAFDADGDLCCDDDFNAVTIEEDF